MSRDNREKFNNLKKQLQDIINTIDECQEGSSTSSSSTSTTRGHSQSSTTASSATMLSQTSSSSKSFASRAVNNFRRAFPALSRPAQGPPIPKRRKFSATSTPFVIRNTFTTTLCCLEKNSDVSPYAKEHYKLSCEGLGKKRLALDKDGNHQHVKTELEKIFPRLKAANGKFQLYRTIGGGSGSRALHKIPIGPEGYTTKWLSDDMAVGGACLYIVPFQQLPKEDGAKEHQVVSRCMPSVTCDICGDSILLSMFEDHDCQREDAVEEILHTSSDLGASDQIEGDRILAEKLQQEEDEVKPSGAIKTAPLTLEEALENIRASRDSMSANYTNLLVQRSRVWNSVAQELKDADLKTYKISVEFIGECAADTGGPTRELFSLLYKDAIIGKLTKGSMPNLTFSHDQSALMAKEYKILGQLVALAFLNNASLPHFFSPTVAHYILGTEYNGSLNSFIDELPADEVIVKEKLNALLSCDTPEAWNDAISKFDERFDMGITKAKISIEEKEYLIRTANKHVMISSVAEEIFSFQEGLSLFGILDALKIFREDAIKYFVFAEVTTEDIRKAFVPRLSVKGSSKRLPEETIVFNFNQFLKHCARGRVQRAFIDISSLHANMLEEQQKTLSLNDVLQFMSGASHLPVTNLNGSIQFIHDAAAGQRIKANNCSLEVSIPVNE